MTSRFLRIDISKELDAADASAATVELLRVWSCFVEIFRPECGRVLFRVNRTKSGGITFSDRRDCQTGIAGTTGLWGTRPPLRIPRPRSLTPNAFEIGSKSEIRGKPQKRGGDLSAEVAERRR